MGAIYLAISHCDEGDIAATDIVDDKGVLLVAKDTYLSKYIIDRLAEKGINNIRIYDDTTVCSGRGESTLKKHEANYKESVMYAKQIITSISSGERLDYTKAVRVSELMYQNIEDCSYIVKCMNTIRTADEYTYYHCINTAFYSMMMGKWLELEEKEIKKLILSGLLHDIGKVKIPNQILNKSGKLTPEEFELMKNHTVFGYEILCEADEVDMEVRRAVLLHHERVDRSGYPFGASPDAIGLYAKVIAIADVFDAMTSERVYKRRTSPFAALEMFNTVGIGCFDTTILYAFLRNISKYYVGINVLLSNGENGKVVYVPPHDILSPIVETGSGYIDLSVKGSPRIL